VGVEGRREREEKKKNEINFDVRIEKERYLIVLPKV
jgi:hypothetical protein